VRFLYYHALGLYLKALLRHKHSVQTAANGPDRRCYRPRVGIVKSPTQRPLDELDLAKAESASPEGDTRRC
jgi:hypothetical protein